MLVILFDLPSRRFSSCIDRGTHRTDSVRSVVSAFVPRTGTDANCVGRDEQNFMTAEANVRLPCLSAHVVK